ncbi:hypothetical protein [Streptomyces oceani]|uniref:Uncharacterized protein n=1 Tax=Streptomyces oceani TaxID=1075402 RepID=A0A1E7JYH8_9ACTN|nr:hypothetical protein [Streptomyces oceani]OEU96721.1 hypothetical protein AN216_19025 [Streptomyces oceani]
MSHTAHRAAARTQRRLTSFAALGVRPGGSRHPLVAAAMVLPMAVLLAIGFGGVDAVVMQASSVVGMLGR